MVCIGGKVFAEEHPISGKTNGCGCDMYYEIDDFLEAVAKSHDCDVDDITTYMTDGNDFAPVFSVDGLEFGAESCGAYINGCAEWLIN